MKNWFASKTNWLGLLMIAAAILEYYIGLPVGTTIAQFAFGVLTIIIRAFTNTAINGTPSAKFK
uniref:Uncharacterized protein n=1 Tax=viral metagenome TaxID=1070528 RepID=A0A6M3JH91_9ZZZZ